MIGLICAFVQTHSGRMEKILSSLEYISSFRQWHNGVWGFSGLHIRSHHVRGFRMCLFARCLQWSTHSRPVVGRTYDDESHGVCVSSSKNAIIEFCVCVCVLLSSVLFLSLLPTRRDTLHGGNDRQLSPKSPSTRWPQCCASVSSEARA